MLPHDLLKIPCKTFVSFNHDFSGIAVFIELIHTKLNFIGEYILSEYFHISGIFSQALPTEKAKIQSLHKNWKEDF